MSIQDVQDEVSHYMDKIIKLFKPGKKITVLVRAPGEPEQDFSMSSDTGPEIVAMIQRRFPSPEVPGSDYDRAIADLAPIMEDGVVVQFRNGATYWCAEDPRIPYGGVGLWEERGLWPTGNTTSRKLPLRIPPATDWRTSLRRIEKGRVAG